MEISEIIERYATVPAIIILCYFVGYLFRTVTGDKTESNKYIPVVVMAAGIILAIIGQVAFPEYIKAANVLEAAAIGVVSGLASTGINQVVYKTFGKGAPQNAKTNSTN